MGMYDTVACSDSLPVIQEMIDLGLDKRDYIFQTKDLDNFLLEFVLQDGILYEKKYKDNKELYLEDRKYHGTLNLYDYRENVKDKWDCWIEYKLTFTAGKMTNATLLVFNSEDNAYRKTKEKEFWDKVKANNNKWYNKYILYTKTGKSIKFIIHKVLYNVGTYIQKLSYKF